MRYTTFLVSFLVVTLAAIEYLILQQDGFLGLMFLGIVGFTWAIYPRKDQ